MVSIRRRRERPILIPKDELLNKAILVARRPGSLGELPAAERDQVDQLAKAIQVGSGFSKAPRTIGQMANQKPVSAAILAARAHQTLGASVAVTPADIAMALQEQGMDWVEPFAPGQPLQPHYGYGRRPRNFDYKVGRNVSTDTREGRIPYSTLKQLYDGYDIAQICTRHAINSLRSMRIRFEAMDGYGENPVKEIAEAKRRLRRPDGKRFIKNWLAQNMLDLMRYDAAPIYRMRDRAGRVTSLKNISAVTIAPMLDYFGDIPESPAPAFQQFIEGVPWDWLTWDDVIYEPFWPATDSPYGTPPLETVLINANTDVRLQLYFLQFFTAGQVPEAFAIAPEGETTPDDLADWQEMYDDWTLGDQAERYGLRWLPHGTELNFYKPQMFDPDLAEYVMRRTVAAYLQTPHDLGFTDDVNRASGDTQMDVQFRISDLPTCGYYEDIFDSILQEDWDLPVQLRFDTGGDKEDRLEEAQAHQIYVGMGAESTDEVREKVLGYPVNPEERVPRFWDSPRLGPVPLEWLMSVSGDVDPLTGAPKPGTVTPREFVMVGQQEPDPEVGGRPNQPHGKNEGGSSGASPKAPGVPVTAGQDKRYPQGGRATPGTRHGASGSPRRPTNGGRAAGAAGYGSPGGSTAQGTGVKAEFDAESDDLRKWKANARKAIQRGKTPRPFINSTIGPDTHERIWRLLKTAETREDVDAAFERRFLTEKEAEASTRDVDGDERPFGGLALHAVDTGRVLMIQRAHVDDDPAGGTWEFPGGHIDEGETCRQGSIREWEEETGCDFPESAEPTGEWNSHNGCYRGHVYEIPSEEAVDLRARDAAMNPDDPNGDHFEAMAWWDPADLSNAPGVRPELSADCAAVQHALQASVLKAGDARPKV